MKLLWLAAASALIAHGATCEGLKDIELANTKIVTAEVVSEGVFSPPSGSPIKDLPVLCRVAGSIQPSADSNIQFEVWMPLTGWNRKFNGIGNGGFAGSLELSQMAGPLKHGYAAATTDTGHTGVDATWAAGHPEKLIDYGYRAIHEMTVKAKAIVTAFYGAPPKRSYFASCSNGGRQALMEAQRYPGDYDGIVAGAPANDFTHIAVGFLWNQQGLLAEPAGFIPPAKVKAIDAAVLAACDARDGLQDGLLSDPTGCKFDPASLACGATESDQCLTASQLASLKRILSGPRNAKGATVFPGFVPGGEAGAGGWTAWITGTAPEKSLQFFFGTQMVKYMLEKPDWDYKSFDVDRDGKLIEDKLSKLLNAVDPNLKPFADRGGKLILFHGWCDAALTPLNTIDYYNRVVSKAGSKRAEKFVRLYMLPGVQHCYGGPGPNRFVGTWTDPQHDMFLALERWVEDGTAPAALIADRAVEPLRSRPVCPYPQMAKYIGTGSIDDAANFACTAAR